MHISYFILLSVPVFGAICDPSTCLWYAEDKINYRECKPGQSRFLQNGAGCVQGIHLYCCHQCTKTCFWHSSTSLTYNTCNFNQETYKTYDTGCTHGVGLQCCGPETSKPTLAPTLFPTLLPTTATPTTATPTTATPTTATPPTATPTTATPTNVRYPSIDPNDFDFNSHAHDDMIGIVTSIILVFVLLE